MVNMIKKADMKKSAWSGGTTTEIAIFPKYSSFKDRSFDVRVSTAMVNDSKSDFTHFEGIHRILMVLSGEMRLFRDGKLLGDLRAGNKTEFEGKDNILCMGGGQDLNLMMRQGYNGAISYHKEKAAFVSYKEADDPGDIIFVYKGKVIVSDFDSSYELSNEDAAHICEGRYMISTLEDSIYAVVKVRGGLV